MMDTDGSSLISFQEFKSVFRDSNHLLADEKMLNCWKELLELMDHGAGFSFDEFKNGVIVLLEKRSNTIFQFN